MDEGQQLNSALLHFLKMKLNEILSFMTRDTYDKATVSLNKFNTFVAIREKIKREFPEFEYDQEHKELGKAIYEVIEAKIKAEADEFGKL